MKPADNFGNPTELFPSRDEEYGIDAGHGLFQVFAKLHGTIVEEPLCFRIRYRVERLYDRAVF